VSCNRDKVNIPQELVGMGIENDCAAVVEAFEVDELLENVGLFAFVDFSNVSELAMRCKKLVGSLFVSSIVFSLFALDVFLKESKRNIGM
jgi:hypothetical protein